MLEEGALEFISKRAWMSYHNRRASEIATHSHIAAWAVARRLAWLSVQLRRLMLPLPCRIVSLLPAQGSSNEAQSSFRCDCRRRLAGRGSVLDSCSGKDFAT